jgi:ATP-dependent DNA helicase UvrD/PcrA
LTTLSGISNKISHLESKLISTNKTEEVIPNHSVEDLISQTDALNLKPGDILYHMKFGKGILKNIEGKSNMPIARIQFESNGEKLIMIQFAKLFKNPIEKG